MNRLIKLICFALTIQLTVSCGLMEMDEIPLTVVEMNFERDTLYTMVGDTMTIKPVFTPDSVSVTDIYWYTDCDTILKVVDNKFIAVNDGWATVNAISVSHQAQDSCIVCVLPKWDIDYPAYPYETVFYADVRVDGAEFNPKEMVLGVFAAGRLCGVGVMRQAQGIKYMQIRAGSTWIDMAGNFYQDISFAIYNHRTHDYRILEDVLEFDGETHGTLSKLYTINF